MWSQCTFSVIWFCFCIASVISQETTAPTSSSTTTTTTTTKTTNTPTSSIPVADQTTTTIEPAATKTTKGSTASTTSTAPPVSSTLTPTTSKCTANAGSSQCKFPFKYKGSVYHACTFNDYHTLWCATETNDAGDFNHEWGHCDHDTCKETRPIRCFQKFAFNLVNEAELLYCRYNEDICVYAYLQHEDGQHYTSQYCANSTSETWWLGDRKPCRYGSEGGFQCACSQTGCNFDDKTAGFIPMEDRFKFILICAFMAIMAFLVLFFFCRCCCCRKKNPSNNFQQHGDPQRQKKNKKLLIFAILAVPILVFILSLNR